MSDPLHRIPRLPGLLYVIFCLTLLAASAAPAAKAADSTLTWHLPSAGFLESHFVHVRVSTPAAALGTRYPVAVALSSVQTDADPSNNAASAQVQLARQTFAPLLAR